MYSCHFQFSTQEPRTQTVLFSQGWRVLAWILLGVFVAPVLASAASMMSASEVAVALGKLYETRRPSAISSMVQNGQIQSPLSSADGATILQGISGNGRFYSIRVLAPLFKDNLNGEEAEIILGTEAILSGGNRAGAIERLSIAKRFSPSLSVEDAVLVLKGTTELSRTHAIVAIAPYLQADLPGQKIATILGNKLTGVERYNAISFLARAGKLRACMSEDDMNLLLYGLNEAGRKSAIAVIANAARPQCIAPFSTGSTPPPFDPSQSPKSAETPCDAPLVAIDKPSPTCQERWQTAIFRHGVGNIFFATNQYIDALNQGAETGDKIVKQLTKYGDLAMFARDAWHRPDLVKNAVIILTKGNSVLLMEAIGEPEGTLGVQMAAGAAKTTRSYIEAIVENALEGKVTPQAVAADVVNLANSLLAYASTVRYSRMRNNYTVALEYLRLLYRMGGDQVAFKRSLSLAPTASVQSCIRAVNLNAFRFSESLTDASAYDPAFVEKVVNHWVTAISEYAALKEQ